MYSRPLKCHRTLKKPGLSHTGEFFSRSPTPPPPPPHYLSPSSSPPPPPHLPPPHPPPPSFSPPPPPPPPPPRGGGGGGGGAPRKNLGVFRVRKKSCFGSLILTHFLKNHNEKSKSAQRKKCNTG